MGHATPQAPTAAQVTIPASSGWAKLYKIAGAIGVVGLLATFGLATTDTHQFYFSYLTSYMTWLAVALGFLFFVIIQFAAKAAWSVVLRRIAENYAMTLPAMAVLFVPILFGMHDLFHWTHEDVVANDPILQGKQGYLNSGFFIVRAAIYLIAWVGMAVWFARQSQRQDETGDHAHTRRMQFFSPAAIAIFSLTVTFAAFDWIMSLDPHWYSTMFGVYYFAGCNLSAFALLAITGTLMSRSGVMGGAANTEHLHDVGKFVFGFTIFWAYIAFSQYMLIWYANIPEETVWYAHRWEGDGWSTLTYVLAFGHFVIPFFFMMPRTIKRNPATLMIGSALVLVMQYVDMYWLIMPAAAGHDGGAHPLHFSIMDLTSFIGIGGIFFAAFGWSLARKPTVPIKDPRLPESLAFTNY